MAKRPNPRAIKGARTYTIPEAAEALGVSVGTVRGWLRQGLSVMTAKRPYLILGEHLRQFLDDRRGRKKVRLSPNQLYCLTCKSPRHPWGGLVDYIAQTHMTARIVGLCGSCGGTCNKMVSRAKLDALVEIFDVSFREGQKA